jgi:nicotinamidase-related amidase
MSAGASQLLVVDMQERLLPHIPVAERTIANCRKLIRGAQILDVPVSATEQYPKGLGATTPELAELLGEMPEKLRFSCAEVLNLSALDEERYQVVVCGIEAHVCVLQTVLDLVAAGLRVYVAADAVASRGKLDWQIALERMRDSGATVTTTESVLFEWCEVAGTEGFRGISALVKEGGGPRAKG